ncbi:MAG TPA: ABC transporter permease [Acetobacteraceae bacterium]|nr:ABC transporter permease [Acetobacteraceae bacterium]
MSLAARLRSREGALALIIAVLAGAVALRAPTFLSPHNILVVLTDTSFLFILALGQTGVLLTRGIDLSVAANLALTGMIVALTAHALPGMPIVAVIALALLVGLGLGLINGFVVAAIGVPPIVTTLGTLTIYRGTIFAIAGGRWLTQSDMSAAFLGFPKATVLGVPALLWVAVIVAAAMTVFLTGTRTGRAIYAVGGNPVAAHYCGIRIARVQVLVYAISGALAGLCGYLWVARYGIAYVEIAIGYELTVIAACVIGGVSIAGGAGSVAGALLGALFLGVIVDALPVIDVSPFWQTALSGAVILAAIVVNARADRAGGKIILPEARRALRAGAR